MVAFLLQLACVVLIACIVSSVETGSRELWSKKVVEFDGKILSEFSREIIHGTSLMYCHTQCLEDAQCMSFFYHHVNKTCQTHGVVFLNPVDGESSPGNEYYRPFQDFCPSSLGYIYNRALNFCYNLHYPGKTNYSSARQVCQNEGGDLIIVDTTAKLLHITQTITASTFPSIFRLGARGGVVADDWQWMDGKTIKLHLWCPGEPNSGGGGAENAYIKIMGDSSGCLDDFLEGLKCHFFCELKV